MEGMRIVGKRFEDEGWEDPSLGGWMLLYVISQVIAIILSVWLLTYYCQEEDGTEGGISSVVVGILSINIVFPIYSIIAIILRLRNAVFLSVSTLIMTLATNIIGLVSSGVSGQFSQNGAFFIGSIAVGIVWLIYFLESRHVSVRFPKEERKIYWFDALALLASGGTTLIACILMILGSGKTQDHYIDSPEAKKIVANLPQLRALKSSRFELEDLLASDREWIAVMKFSEPGESDSKMMKRLADFGFRSRIRNLLTDEAPLFMQAVAEDGADFRAVVFLHKPGDGMEYVFPNEEIREMLKMGPANARSGAKYTDEELNRIIDEVETLWPRFSSDAIILETKNLNEGILTYTYIVDESKSSVAEVDDYFGGYVGNCCKTLVTLAEHGNETCRRFSKADVEIRMILKGSRTRFTKRYDMMHSSELAIE